jgi:hypothetical protein
MSAPTVPVRAARSRVRAILVQTVGMALAAWVLLLGKRAGSPPDAPPVARAPAVTEPAVNDLARLREFAGSVARRVVLMPPGERLPPHLVVREYRGGWGSLRDLPGTVSPELLFEEALQNAARESGWALQPARVALRDFAAQVRAGAASDFLDEALAHFVEQDYAGAEELALGAVAEIERGSRSATEPGDGSAELLRVIADSGQKVREANVRLRAALRVAGDARLLQFKYWEAETSCQAAARLVSRDEPAWIDAQWRLALAKRQRGEAGESTLLWQGIIAASTARYGAEDRLTLTARSWEVWDRVDPTIGAEVDTNPLKEILALRKVRYGPEDLDVARSLCDLSRERAAFTPPNDSWVLEALHILEKQLGHGHPEVLRCLRKSVGILRQRSDPMAESHARRALALGEQLFGREHLEVATDARALAETLDAGEHGPEIEALDRRVLAIRSMHLGWDHPKTAEVRSALDEVLEAHHKPRETESFLRARVKTSRQQHGSEHVETARSLHALGLFLLGGEHKEESVPVFRQALAVCDVLLGEAPEDVPNVDTRLRLLTTQVDALEHLRESVPPEVAAAEHLDYRLSQARGPLLKTRMDLEQSRVGWDHPDVADYLEDYAEFIHNWGKPAEAEPLFRRLLEIRLRLFGPEDSSVLHPLRALYYLQQERGALAESEALARWMLEYQQKRPDGNRADEAERLYDLATVLEKQSKSQEYETEMRRALAAWDACSPPLRSLHRSAHIEALREMAQYYRTGGRHSEVEVLYRRALGLLKEANWGGIRALVSVEFGEWLGEAGRYAEAEALLREAPAQFRDTDGEPECRAAGALGLACARQGKYEDAKGYLSAALAHLRQRKADLETLMQIRRTKPEHEVPMDLRGRLLHFASGVGAAEWLRDEPARRAPLEKLLAEAEVALTKDSRGHAP